LQKGIDNRSYFAFIHTEKSLMNHLLSSILLAIVSNIDNFGIGLAYGVIPKRIYIHHNLLIAIVSATGTLASMSAGEWINNYMSESFANILGSFILIAIGVYNILQTFRQEHNRLREGEEKPSDLEPQFGTSGREASALAISLTFNNLGGGLGAGISHLDIPLTALLTMVLSIVAIIAGLQLGKSASKFISKFGLGIASGLLIILVGVYEIFH